MFSDRQEAGRLLAEKLVSLKGKATLVLGLARGGVAVSHRIAVDCGLPQDVLVVKKIASPLNAELAIGAVAPDGVRYVDYPLAQSMGADENYVRTKISELSDVVHQKLRLYRKGKKPILVRDQTIILADDGIATGASMFAAVSWAKKKGAKRIIVAVPVAALEAVHKLESMGVEVVILRVAKEFGAVGEFYTEFPQLSDEDVVSLLARQEEQHYEANHRSWKSWRRV